MLSLLLLFVAPAQAIEQSYSTNDGLGLGVLIGSPTGFSGTWRSGRSGFAGALAWNIPLKRIHVHGDYQFEVFSWTDPLLPEVRFPFYLGVGARVRTAEDETEIGVRIPFVGAVEPRELELPVEAFLEIAPVIGLYPSTGLGLDAAIGVRVYPFSGG